MSWVFYNGECELETKSFCLLCGTEIKSDNPQEMSRKILESGLVRKRSKYLFMICFGFLFISTPLVLRSSGLVRSR